jgi:hypothetical protein
MKILMYGVMAISNQCNLTCEISLSTLQIHADCVRVRIASDLTKLL